MVDIFVGDTTAGYIAGNGGTKLVFAGDGFRTSSLLARPSRVLEQALRRIAHIIIVSYEYRASASFGTQDDGRIESLTTR